MYEEHVCSHLALSLSLFLLEFEKVRFLDSNGSWARRIKFYISLVSLDNLSA